MKCILLVEEQSKSAMETPMSPRSCYKIQDGSFLGEAALLHQQPRNATAISLDYRDLYYLSKSDFEEILDRNPGFAQYI
jgi:CRP/FNR family cyclic AMP-dependent transcriptional regulator